MSKKKQTVLKVDVNCEKCQKEIFAKVGKIKGIQSLVVNEEKKTLTVVGTAGPAAIFKALKKIKKNPEIMTVGPPKPKCQYCQYIQSNCTCGMGSINNFRGYSYPHPPPIYDPWNQPPPVYDPWCQPPYSSSSYNWPNRPCEYVAVPYPPPPPYESPGQCSIF